MTQSAVRVGDQVHFFEDLPKRDGLRWAVGDPTGLRSSTWRLWGDKKGDVYLAVRHLGGVMKVSFHRDRRCHAGLTSEYMRDFGNNVEGSRHWDRWRLPDVPVARAMQIIVPHDDLVKMESAPDEKSQMRWIPAPGPGHAAVVTVFIAEPPEACDLGGGSLIGFLACPTRTTWAVHTSQLLGPREQAFIAAGRNQALAVSGDAAHQPGSRLTLWGGDPASETPYVAELSPLPVSN